MNDQMRVTVPPVAHATMQVLISIFLLMQENNFISPITVWTLRFVNSYASDRTAINIYDMYLVKTNIYCAVLHHMGTTEYTIVSLVTGSLASLGVVLHVTILYFVLRYSQLRELSVGWLLALTAICGVL